MTPYEVAPMNIPCIGWAGFARSGKDTCADAIVRELGWVKVAFADELKREVESILGINRTFLESRKSDLRELLVGLGKGRRLLDESHWITEVKKTLVALRADHPKGIVFSDCRYANEENFIRSLGGKVYFVERPGVRAANPEEFASTQPLLRKASPIPTRARIGIVKNDGSIADLQKIAVRLARDAERRR